MHAFHPDSLLIGDAQIRLHQGLQARSALRFQMALLQDNLEPDTSHCTVGSNSYTNVILLDKSVVFVGVERCRLDVADQVESVSIFDSSDLTRFIVDSHVFTLPSKPSSTLPRNARSSVLPSRALLHLSIGLHCLSGFKHHIAVNACTLRLLPEERQV